MEQIHLLRRQIVWGNLFVGQFFPFELSVKKYSIEPKNFVYKIQNLA